MFCVQMAKSAGADLVVDCAGSSATLKMSLEMVRRYVTLASSQVRVQHRKFSPMDRMNLGRVSLGRMYQNGPSNGNGLPKKRNAVKNGSYASPEI